MAYPNITAYWWVVVLAALVVVALRQSLRERVLLCGSLALRIFSRPVTYMERIRSLTLDQHADVTAAVMKEKEALQRQNADLMRTIRNLAREHKRAYRFEQDIIDRDIGETGDDTTNRLMRVAAITETISWIDLGYGSTAPDPYVQGVTFDMPTILDGDGRTLQYQFYEDGPTNKRLLVFLPRPLRVGDPSQAIRVMRRIRRTWMDLMDHLEDFSRYEAQNEVQELTLVIRVPPRLRIARIDIDSAAANATVASDQMSATLRATGLKQGVGFQYTIRCLRAG